MDIYNVEFNLGQALVKAKSATDARKYSEKEWGANHGPYKITHASASDLQWVKSMGGYVHEA